MNESTNGTAKWLGAVLVLCLLGLLAWKAYESGDTQAPLPASKASAPSAEWRGWGQMFGSADNAIRVVQVTPAPSGPAEVPQVVKVDNEICGAGSVKADAPVAGANPQRGKVPIQRPRDRLLTELAQSPSEVARAAGWLIQSTGVFPGQDGVDSCGGPGCAGQGKSPALAAARPASAPPETVAREALVNMALTTRSAHVYAMAMQVCSRQHNEGACRLLSADQWALLDSDNAVAWLQVAQDAKQREDVSALDEALFRMAHASVSDTRSGLLPALVASNIPADVPLSAKRALLTDVLGLEGMTLVPNYQVVTQYCSVANVRDFNRQQTCAALADVLSAKGNTLLDVGLGITLGERSGWPPQRGEALRQERDALVQISARALPDFRGASTCAAMEQMITRMSEVAMYGEVGALRRAVAQSGETVASLAKIQVEARGAGAAAAAAAMAAASAASSAAVASIQ